MGRRARPTKVPVLRPCPGCGIGLEDGRGPHGLVFHECRPQVEDDDLTLEGVRRRLHRAILERASTASPKELAELYRSLGDQQPRGKRSSGDEPPGGADAMLRWLNREAAARRAG